MNFSRSGAKAEKTLRVLAAWTKATGEAAEEATDNIKDVNGNWFPSWIAHSFKVLLEESTGKRWK